MILDKQDKQYIEDLLVKYRNFEPFSVLIKEIKEDQKEINQKIHNHLNSEESAHNALMEEIKKINEIIQTTPLVNRAVLSGIGLIVVASVMGFIGFAWTFISSKLHI